MRVLLTMAALACLIGSGCTARAQPATGEQPKVVLRAADPTSIPGAAKVAAPSAGVSVTGGNGRAEPEGGVCPAGHPIKASVSAKGERLYYEPERREYGDIKPEACFTAGSFARAAGYTNSKR